MDTTKIISSEQEYLMALNEIEPYLQKGFANLSEDEDEYLAQITAMIANYESDKYPLPFKPKTLVEMLELKMFENKMKQKDLAIVLNVSENRISEIMNGKRKINLELAKRIHAVLKVDANFILESA
ncbi:MAG: helix-turn-helix domain-containing protein [Saprospiraceae bacterium]